MGFGFNSQILACKCPSSYEDNSRQHGNSISYKSSLSRASWDEESVKGIWSHYWGGGGKLEVEIPRMFDGKIEHKIISRGEIWEYLVEGRLDLMGN